MNKAGQTICLCMIVKNESRVIERCLASVRGLIDAWAIVDTGSVDGTQDLIRQTLHDLAGKLLERPWVNFGHNRTEALQLARGRAEYVLVIDADEELVQDPDFELPRLTADAYTAEVFYSGCTYLRRQLVRTALAWRYEGVLHEYITCEAALSEDHKLITTGPYRWLRNPIYASMLGMLLQTGLAKTWWLLFVLGVIFFVIGTEIRVRAEERLLAERFGDEFTRYKATTPAYMPFLR